jgi:hypothetical protein
MSNLQLGSWNDREEARKSWDYVPCHECVYLAEPDDAYLEGSHVLAEKYVRNDLWFHIRWTGTKAGEAWDRCIDALIECVMFDPACRSLRHKVNSPIGAIDWDRPMFVEVPQLVELPEMMRVYGIHSVARLKGVKSGMNAGVKQSTFLPVSLIGAANREGNFASGFVGRNRARKQIDQVPSKLVERCTETVDEIPNCKCDFFRRSIWSDYEKVIRSVRIVLFDHHVGVALNPVPELGLGRLEVKVSPSGFHVNVFK